MAFRAKVLFLFITPVQTEDLYRKPWLESDAFIIMSSKLN